MRIASVNVTKLFGVFDHSIPLQSAERLTIIHGPNGFGKTVILRMIDALVKGHTSVFKHTPFSEFRLTFDDGSAAVVQRETLNSDGEQPSIHLKYLKYNADGLPVAAMDPPPLPSDLPRSLLNRIDSVIPGPYQLRGATWQDDGGREYSLSEILALFPRARKFLPNKYRSEPSGPYDLGVFFVQANRLASEPSVSLRDNLPGPRGSFDRVHQEWYDDDEPSPDPAPLRVMQYSRDVVQRIQSVLADYAKHSQERDRTFPERLVRFVQDGHTTLPAADITGRMGELEKQRQRLISLGLLDSESGLRDLSEEDVRRAPEALTIYLGDVEEKLRVFEDIASRIGALMDIVNGRFKYKRLRIDRDTGFHLLSDLKDNIRLGDLSSGEQHELVLLYELLFRAPMSGLVLIDEPEISLHVAWQSRVLTDLIKILELTGAYALVATHSPTIIGTRWDLAVELKGPDASP